MQVGLLAPQEVNLTNSMSLDKLGISPVCQVARKQSGWLRYCTAIFTFDGLWVDDIELHCSHQSLLPGLRTKFAASISQVELDCSAANSKFFGNLTVA